MPRADKRKASKRLPAKAGRRRPVDGRDRLLRGQLVSLLSKEQAHVGFDGAFADFPVHLRGMKIAGSPHTPWQLLEHIRIAQWDILEFSRNSRHVSPPFPHGYWPPTETPPDAASWDRSLSAFRVDLRAMIALVKNPRIDLFARIPHGEGQTILREAMLVADHNAYHLGQIVMLRRLADSWEPD
jgi:DinB superfamily